MNAYFNKNEAFDSNKRMIEAYFGESATRANRLQRLLESMLYALSLILQALTSATARRIAKAISVAILLVGFIGVIGAMESGAIGLGAGLAIGAVLIGLEVLCLCPHRG